MIIKNKIKRSILIKIKLMKKISIFHQRCFLFLSYIISFSIISKKISNLVNTKLIKKISIFYQSSFIFLSYIAFLSIISKKISIFNITKNSNYICTKISLLCINKYKKYEINNILNNKFSYELKINY